MLDSLNWQQPWTQLTDRFYRVVPATPLDQPYIVDCDPQAAALLGLTVEQLHRPENLGYFNGEEALANAGFVATVYGGHQFGIYTSQLGDGRALITGVTGEPPGHAYEIQLKGAGLTPFSRTLDGRLPLSAAVTEYLGSVALSGLGVPCTRGLSLLGSETLIRPEQPETAAILVRMARSHIRFGHFEYFHHRDEQDELLSLVGFVIERLFPELLNEPAERRPVRLLETIIERTATLIADWQALGFVHGVMNTDNMSVIGDTLDLGPFGFMEAYDPAFSPNPSDDQQRYRFDQQPDIGRWNCLALASALSSFLPGKIVPARLLRLYRNVYQQHYQANMNAKLGLQKALTGDAELVADLLEILAACAWDYSGFFSQLTRYQDNLDELTRIDDVSRPDMLAPWLQRYRERLTAEDTSVKQRLAAMTRINPSVVLRAHTLRQATQAAAQGDFSDFKNLLARLRHPFQAEGADVESGGPVIARENSYETEY